MDSHAHYLGWMKNKYIVNSPFQTPMNAFNNSWEEQAFADDVAFIWPPRSYSCSFCKRKFRSAQALGGHMNVHRRDRARLKLSPTSPNEELSPNQNNNLISSNPNPNPNCEPNFLTLSNSPCLVLDPKIGFQKNVRSRKDLGLMGDGDCVEDVNLSVGLSLVVCDHGERVKSKRHKTNAFPMALFVEPCSKGLDLELRLGDSPKAK